MEKDRARKRLEGLISEIATNPKIEEGKKKINFRFNLKPIEIIKNNNGRIIALEFEGKDKKERIDCDLLIKSIGYDYYKSFFVCF